MNVEDKVQEDFNNGLMEGIVMTHANLGSTKEEAILALSGLDFDIEEIRDEVDRLWEHFNG